jgi:hypothetical protein
MCCFCLLFCLSCSVTGPLRVDFTWFDPSLGYSSSEARAAFRRTLFNHRRDDWGRASSAAAVNKGLGHTNSRIGSLISARAASGVADAGFAAAAATAATAAAAAAATAGVKFTSGSSLLPTPHTTKGQDTGNSSSTIRRQSIPTSTARVGAISTLSTHLEHAGVQLVGNS